MSLPEWPRRPQPRALTRTRFDLAIIGGGIHGCGIARDAALRGLKVALFEKGDIGSGTSSASSKLVHGGLRYLEQWRLGLVREALRERSTLLRIAPHLVRPLPFLLPLYEDAVRGRWKLTAGLSLYEFLAGRSRIASHGWLSAKELLAREPSLEAGALRGGFHFADAQMNDARLCLENALDARRQGAEIWNYMEVEHLLETEGRVHGVRVVDRRDGQHHEVQAQLVVSATGPWYGRLRHGSEPAARVRLSKGSHIVTAPLTHGNALLLTARSDGRVFFVLPYKGRSIVGTTEIEIEGSPDDIQVSETEIAYLLGELRSVFGAESPTREGVLASFCGVRSLSAREETEIGAATREAEIVEEAPGLLGIVGGKYTTYRSVAERCVDRTLRLLEVESARPCRTAALPLPGGEPAAMDETLQLAEELVRERHGIDGATLRYLAGTYGSCYPELLAWMQVDPTLGERLEPDLPFTRGEIVRAVRVEGARTLDDLIWRRTYRAFLGPLDGAARRRWEDALRLGLSH